MFYTIRSNLNEIDGQRVQMTVLGWSHLTTEQPGKNLLKFRMGINLMHPVQHKCLTENLFPVLPQTTSDAGTQNNKTHHRTNQARERELNLLNYNIFFYLFPREVM